MRRSWWLTLAALAAWAVLSGGPARADFVVVPNALAHTEGDPTGPAPNPATHNYPFNIGAVSDNGGLDPGGLSTQRYQQVYLFGQFPTGKLLISQILFRPDRVLGAAFSSTLPGIRIDLSSTSAGVGSLGNFATNVGPDNATVYGGPGGAALSLSSAFMDDPLSP